MGDSNVHRITRCMPTGLYVLQRFYELQLPSTHSAVKYHCHPIIAIAYLALRT